MLLNDYSYAPLRPLESDEVRVRDERERDLTQEFYKSDPSPSGDEGKVGTGLRLGRDGHVLDSREVTRRVAVDTVLQNVRWVHPRDTGETREGRETDFGSSDRWETPDGSRQRTLQK